MSRSRVKGASKLRRKLQRMPDDIQNPIKKTLERGAKVIYLDALKNVPIDEGDLARSLHKAKKSSGMSWFVGWWKKGNKRNWNLGGWRAHFAEFGTKGYKKGATRTDARTKTTKKLSKGLGAQTATPMLGPAYRNNERWLRGQIKAAINRALRQASKL